MSTTVTAKSGQQLWGIYHADREETRSHDDPPRTTVEASSKIAAEEAAAKLGFDNPWAHPITSEVVTLAQSVLRRFPNHRREFVHKPSNGIHV